MACGHGIISNSLGRLDNSTYNIQLTLLLNFKSHYNHHVSVQCVSETWVSLRRRNYEKG